MLGFHHITTILGLSLTTSTLGLSITTINVDSKGVGERGGQNVVGAWRIQGGVYLTEILLALLHKHTKITIVT